MQDIVKTYAFRGNVELLVRPGGGREVDGTVSPAARLRSQQTPRAQDRPLPEPLPKRALTPLVQFDAA